MQHPRAAQPASTSAALQGDAPSLGRRDGASLGPGREMGLDAAQIRGLALGASRELRSPLAALRVLLEGARGGQATEGFSFAERALEEIDRAEAAAHDVLAWTMPRSLRSTATTLGEIVQSLRASLKPSDRRRTHFVVEQEETGLETDAPLLVESFERSLRHIYRVTGHQEVEVMVHIHASAGLATFSFIHTGAGTMPSSSDGASRPPTLADALLHTSILRLGGTTSVHDAEGHRCTVITLPLDGSQAQSGEA